MSQAMTGTGDYDRHSDAQFRHATSNARLVTDAADAVSAPAWRSAVVLADYGCAQGRQQWAGRGRPGESHESAGASTST